MAAPDYASENQKPLASQGASTDDPSTSACSRLLSAPILCAFANERSLSAAGADRDRTSVLTALRTRPGYLGGAPAKHSCARTPPRLRSVRERDLSLDPSLRRMGSSGVTIMLAPRGARRRC